MSRLRSHRTDTSSAGWDRALVTGASSGIGDAMARALAARGTDLVIVARDRARLERLAAELRPRSGVDVEVIAADLAEAEQLATVERRLESEQAPIDLLVNNAGFGTGGTVGEIDLDEETREIAVNVTALARLTFVAVGRMVTTGHGWVVNISSVAGLQPAPRSATYGATKAFVNSFSESLHEELRGSGVGVTAVLPGFTRTEFQARTGASELILEGSPLLWMTAEFVAAEALDAAANRRAWCVPGVHYRTAAALASTLPRGLKRRLAGLVTRGR